MRYLLTLCCLVALTAAEPHPPRLAILGDSVSTAHPQRPPGPLLTWVDVLTRLGRIDAGVANANDGLSRVYACDGATTTSVLEEGWPDAIAAALASDAIDGAVVLLGHDDLLAMRPLLYAAASARTALDAAGVTSALEAFAQRYDLVLARLAPDGAAAHRVVVCTLADWRATPAVRDMGLPHATADSISEVVRRANAAIRQLATRRGMAVADTGTAYLHLACGRGPVQVGGVAMRRRDAGDDVACLFRADRAHLTTLASALLTPPLLDQVGSRLGLAIPSPTSTEILATAGIAPAQEDVR
jgi:hypothetical protein